MNILPFQKLACPIEGEPLHNNGSSWLCSTGHCFDIASKGYTNLLPVQHKRSLDPGDHKTMVAARQRFLHVGFYLPIADAVNQTILSICDSSETNTFSLLDAGCGEGYYLRELAKSSSDKIEFDMEILGLDISKWAVQAAAKQSLEFNWQPTWTVASNVNIPALANSFDCVLCMFGFPVYTEFMRVLKSGGHYIQVDAGPKHLRELRDIIYPSLKEEKNELAKQPSGFTRLSSENIDFSISLSSNSQITDLLAMTPHFYRASAEGRDKTLALNKLSLTVDIQVSTYLAKKSSDQNEQ